MKKCRQDITTREMELVQTLWTADEPLIASELVRKIEGQTTNGVQSVLRTLLQKGFVEVFDVRYSGTVLSRSYKVTEICKECYMNNIYKQLNSLKNAMSLTEMFRFLISNEDLETLEIVHEYLREKKRQILSKQEG